MSLALFFRRIVPSSILFVVMGNQMDAQVRYTAMSLGSFGGSGGGADSALMGSSALNNAGQIAGALFPVSEGGNPTVAWFNGSKVVNLGDLGAAGATGVAIDDEGTITGSVLVGPYLKSEAYILDHGEPALLGFLNGGTTSIPVGINGNGDVIGYGDAAQKIGHRGFLYHNGVMTDIGDLGGLGATPRAINTAGQIVGSSQLQGTSTTIGPIDGFLYQQGQMIDLGGWGGGFCSPQAINTNGVIVGAADYPNHLRRAFLYANTQMTELGALGAGLTSWAYAINDAGEIVGTGSYTSAGAQRAFVYRAGAMQDLDLFLEPTTGKAIIYPDTNGKLLEADAINRSGQILAISNAVGTVMLSPVAPGHLSNFSIRGYIDGSQPSITAGFVVQGPPGKKVLVRGVGPGLASLGLSSCLSDPVMTMYSGTSILASNVGWSVGAGAQVAALQSLMSSVGAFSLPPGSGDSAIVDECLPGAYTVTITSQDGGSGVSLAEIYDADTISSSRFINGSGLLVAGPGDRSAIASFVISGNYGDTVMLRAVGPGLARFGLTGLLARPQLFLLDSAGNQLASNSGWAGDAVTAQIASQIGAFPLDKSSSDAVLTASLKPGSYSIVVNSQVAGLVLLEVYEIQ